VLTKNEAIPRLNQLGKDQIPFSFYCDFLGEQWCIEEDESEQTAKSFQLEIVEENSAASIQKPGIRNQEPQLCTNQSKFVKHPISYSSFEEALDYVISEINFGNSFLTNLTFQTPIETNLTLAEIHHSSRAKYRLLVPDQFVVFSPETFVRIKGDKIYSYPMKGTIDASIENAENTLLGDPKEIAEHVTIVDLIRNDLSQVANEVTVTKFRFIDEIKTNQKHLLQVSSEICGSLPPDWHRQLGDILAPLLPAGSISGAPKPETVRIIKQIEDYERGFYTGICGRYDGVSLDTGVMIRFIKKVKDQLYFCSGGGITSFSETEKEYHEMVDKVYLPL